MGHNLRHFEARILPSFGNVTSARSRLKFRHWWGPFDTQISPLFGAVPLPVYMRLKFRH